MNNTITEIDNLIIKIGEITSLLYQNNTSSAYKFFNNIMPQLNDIIAEFIEDIPRFKQFDVDIPQEVILSQLDNLLDAFENKDTIMLADTLEYEIKQALMVYKDILEQLDKDGIKYK